jgi:hypothetical protein
MTYVTDLRADNIRGVAPRRMSVRLVWSVVALAGVVCGACASSPTAVRAPSPGVSQTSVGAPGTAAANKQRAEVEASRLLALVQLPARATAIATPPPLLHKPMMSVATSSLVDQVRLWRVSMAFSATVAWIRAHPPAGLSKEWQSMGSSEPSGIGYADHESAAWQQAQLQIAVVSVSDGGSAIRADAMVAWLDPRPLTDDATGTRLRVTIEGGCPATDRGYVGVTNPSTGDLAKSMLPAAAASAGLLCRYAGVNGKPSFALTAHQPLTRDAARQLAALVGRIPLDHLDDEARSCPMDDGSVTVLVISYPGRADVDLWYARTGCQTLSNGHIRTGLGIRSGDFAAAVAGLGG